MKDLYRCLDEYSSEMLQALAAVWHVPPPASDSRDALVAMVEAMLTPAAIGRVLEELSSDARSVLAHVQTSGGTVPGHGLALSFGSMRRLGPARMAREQPWAHPESPVEELYYRGLLHRAYGQIGSQYDEVLFIPQQLYDALPPLEKEADLAPLSPPDQIQHDGGALAEDIFAVLAHLRQRRVPVPDGDLRPGVCPSAIADWPWAARFLGKVEPHRLGLLWSLLRRLRLVTERNGNLQPSLRARDWLRLSDVERQARLWAAWREDPDWDELSLLPEIEVREVSPAYSPAMARKRLLASLGELPPEQWMAVDAWLRRVQVRDPGFLRGEDGAGWSLRLAAPGQAAESAQGWWEIEGRVARFFVSVTLRWLGIVSTGPVSDDPLGAQVFCLTAQGHEFLSGRQHEAETSGEASRPEDAPLATVDDDLTLSVLTRDTAYERYQIERFAEWVSHGEQATYRISAESVWGALNAGIHAEQVVSFLRRISADRVPVPVVGALRAWAGKFGHATVRRAAVLQTVDVRTMDQIEACAQLAGLLGQAVTPTVRLVDEEHLDELVRHLKDCGLWPRVRL